MPIPPANRTASITRQTRETKVELSLNLDGQGAAAVHTGVGFFDHMLDLLGRHSLLDLNIEADGDLEVDAHHTVEDVGIVLGQALEKALGDKRGIHRYGWAIVPMDESLAQVAIDLSGRPAFVFNVVFNGYAIGDFPAELVEEFFKATARALRHAVGKDPRSGDEVPSTKGSL